MARFKQNIFKNPRETPILDRIETYFWFTVYDMSTGNKNK